LKKPHWHSGGRRDPLGGHGRGRNGSEKQRIGEADLSLTGASGELSTEGAHATNAALESWLPSIVASIGQREVWSEVPVEQRTHAQLDSWLSQWQPTETKKKKKKTQDRMGWLINPQSMDQAFANVKQFQACFGWNEEEMAW
jgi:hypothetical protein